MIESIRAQEVDESGIGGVDAVGEEQDSRPGASSRPAQDVTRMPV
jgi:hypothetical protein